MRHAEQIFEPFRRLQRDGSRGTGIGLAICRKIVESRAGRIWAESKPGTGSTFSFLVPIRFPTINNKLCGDVELLPGLNLVRVLQFVLVRLEDLHVLP